MDRETAEKRIRALYWGIAVAFICFALSGSDNQTQAGPPTLWPTWTPTATAVDTATATETQRPPTKTPPPPTETPTATPTPKEATTLEEALALFESDQVLLSRYDDNWQGEYVFFGLKRVFAVVTGPITYAADFDGKIYPVAKIMLAGKTEEILISASPWQIGVVNLNTDSKHSRLLMEPEDLKAEFDAWSIGTLVTLFMDDPNFMESMVKNNPGLVRGDSYYAATSAFVVPGDHGDHWKMARWETVVNKKPNFLFMGKGAIFAPNSKYPPTGAPSKP